MTAMGIKREQWQEIPAKTGGFELPPKGIGHLFTISEVKPGVDKDGMDYVQFVCEMSDDAGKLYRHWEFCSLSEERISYTKGFILGIGRGDLLADDSHEWEDFKGTEFKGDISHKEIKGELRSNLNMKTLVPVSHEYTEIPDPPQAAPEPAKPAPARSVRGGAAPR